jgi:GNAT superfamily N-acetyltransferase
MQVRTNLEAADIQAIIDLHGSVYVAEYGWNVTVKAHVAGPLMAFAKRPSPRSRIWIAEEHGRILGTVAIVEASQDAAQLRWFLVAPDARRHGLGTTFLNEAISFASLKTIRRSSFGPKLH